MIVGEFIMSEAKNKTINSEQLYAGALLKFGWLDNIDMVIILDSIRNHSDIEYIGMRNRKSEIYKYMQIDYGVTALYPNYTLDTKVGSKAYGVITLRRKLELMMNKVVKEYFNNIDLYWFVLKKVNYMAGISGTCDIEAFNPLEQSIIFDLLSQGLLTKETSEEEEFDFNITNLGKVYLFKKENKNLVDQFRMAIMSLGYRENDLDRYLLTQSLNSNVSEILDVEKFKLFYQRLTPNISRN